MDLLASMLLLMDSLQYVTELGSNLKTVEISIKLRRDQGNIYFQTLNEQLGFLGLVLSCAGIRSKKSIEIVS